MFRDAAHRELDQTSSSLATDAERVTITFEDQKNGTRMVKRTHQRTSDPVLCPVRRLASLVARIHRRIPQASPDTPLSSMCLRTKVCRVSSTSLRNALRSTCTLMGGKDAFGYTAADIGTRSLRSGAAMSLFLMNHPVAKLMILGRWSSDAFLVYIRPQVLEWTNNMSRDMIQNNSFFDATDNRRTPPTDPCLRTHQFNAARPLHPVIIQGMHLHH